VTRIDEEKTRGVSDEFVVDHHNDDELNVQVLEVKNKLIMVALQLFDPVVVVEMFLMLFARNFDQLKIYLIVHVNVVYEQDPYVDHNNLLELLLNRPLNL